MSTLNQTSEDKLARLLKRAPFEEVRMAVRATRDKRTRPGKPAHRSTATALKQLGWTSQEYMNELSSQIMRGADMITVKYLL